MRVFLTGGTGFIGGEVARLLRERGDEVRALVRDPARADRLADIGCDLTQGDLSDQYLIRAGLEQSDALIHTAAVYEVGITPGRRQQMWQANVAGTETVLGAAVEAGVRKVVYVSTVGALGNTDGEVVDETHRNAGRYTSYYEETKHRAHEVARRLIEQGLPAVIVMPGAVYGPGDTSQIGNVIHQFLSRRLPVIPFPDFGVNAVHRDDVAAGILLALDKGSPGDEYVLGGEITTMRGLIETVARVTGRTPPKRELPTPLVRALAPAGRVLGPLLGFPPNLRELVSSSDKVTFWASDERARRELGYSPRGLEEGIRQTYGA
jgi:nucleoside-diphosphate-sugar epimerase